MRPRRAAVQCRRLPHIAPAEEAGEPHPAQQQERLEPSPSASAENHRRQAELEPRHQPEHAAAQGERFHGLRLDDAPEELAGALLAHLLRRQPQGAGQQAPLEESAGADGEPALRPGDQQAQRHQGEQQQRPGHQPAAVEAPLERPLPHQPPGEEPQHVLRGMRPKEDQEALGQAGVAQLVPEGCAGRAGAAASSRRCAPR